MEKIMWLVLGGVAFVAALRAGDSQRARLVGRWAVGVLFIAFGAAVNAIYVTVGTDAYASFADASPFAFVRDTWESLVVPHQGFFITVLIVAEATAGLLVLAGGRMTQLGLVSLMAFHVGQLAFGGVLWVWAPFMLVTLGLLLRAERCAAEAELARPRPEQGLPGPTELVADDGPLPLPGRTGHVDRHA
ncbi:hypothetical protein [Nocardioides iriomotensis]|uniref:DoxX family membrane protein n=1 Tax=Nocardioides iriomotensis TaxID=715784 RepID=A0A4Q5J272_9ACTN|nr:hypothetical protein [Nocardioides iriomotensis]RYU11531.1 hypothetical protein ETU37_13255 [Nocardioides iriomotensis]